MTASGRRWLAAVLAVIAALLLVTPASAAPSPKPPAEDESPLLGDVLAVTGKQYLQAKTALEKSRKAQLRLALEVNAERLRALTEARERAASAKAAMDAEVAQAAKAQAVMAKQKREAEKALALVGGFKLTGGFVSATSPIARPAPRGPDGQFRDESCSVDDPTTGGCITPRTLHAYKEVKRAGFDRFVGCFRSGGPYEHPKGRACDWSLRDSGFATAANRDQKMYGNNLAAFLIRNADRLGILYVI